MSARRKLGTYVSLVERSAVYLVDQSLEVENSSGVTIERSRLFFEDVRMLTWHEHYQRALIWIFGIICVLELGGYFIMLVVSSDPGAFAVQTIVFAFLFLPFLACFLITARHRLRITVYGRRNQAVMQWTWKYEEGRAVFHELARLIEATQAAKRAQLAAAAVRAGDHFAPPPEALADPAAPTVSDQSGPGAQNSPWAEPWSEQAPHPVDAPPERPIG